MGAALFFTKCIWVFHICFLDWDDIPPSSALEVISEEEAVQIIAEPLVPLQSSTLRDYVDHSETLEKLVHLGMCDFFCVVCLWQELRRSCNLCFALTGYPVNLKMETVTNGKKLQNIMWGKRPKSNVTSNANYWETKLAGVSPIVLWVLEGGISHSFRRWGSLCNLICLSFFGLVKDALICCKICSSPSLEGRKEREWLLCIILGARHCTLDRQEGRDWQKPSFSSKNTLDYRVQTSWAPCYPNVQGRLERGWKNSYLRGGICPHVARNFRVWVTSLQNCPLSFYNRFGNFIHTYFCATRASL